MCNLRLQDYSECGHPGQTVCEESCDSFYYDYSEFTCRDPYKRRFFHRFLPGYCSRCLEREFLKDLSEEDKAALDAFLKDLEGEGISLPFPPQNHNSISTITNDLETTYLSTTIKTNPQTKRKRKMCNFETETYSLCDHEGPTTTTSRCPKYNDSGFKATCDDPLTCSTQTTKEKYGFCKECSDAVHGRTVKQGQNGNCHDKGWLENFCAVAE
ncbi:MAG: hypothetical protein Q9226_000173 [Calogaya cf. arnoldii]